MNREPGCPRAWLTSPTPVETPHRLHCLAKGVRDRRVFRNPLRELSTYARRSIPTIYQDERSPVISVADGSPFVIQRQCRARDRYDGSNVPILWFTAFMHMFSYSSVAASLQPPGRFAGGPAVVSCCILFTYFIRSCSSGDARLAYGSPIITTARARSSVKFSPSESFAPMTAKRTAPPLRDPPVSGSFRI